MEALENDVRDLKSALLGTLDGKQPGIMSTLQSLVESRKQDSDCMTAIASKVEKLGFNWAKASGVAVGVTAVLGTVYELFLKR